MATLLSRQVKLDATMRCDYCHRPIEKGKYATLIAGGGDVKAQGRYHGTMCYKAALADYERKEKELQLTRKASE